MNWSIAVIGAVILFPGIWWVWRARHVYIKDGSSIAESGAEVVEGLDRAGSAGGGVFAKA